MKNQVHKCNINSIITKNLLLCIVNNCSDFYLQAHTRMIEFISVNPFQVNFWYLTFPLISTCGEYSGLDVWEIGFIEYPSCCCCTVDELLLMLIEDCCWGGCMSTVVPRELSFLKQQHPQHLQQQTSNSIKNSTDPIPQALWDPALWEFHQ